MKSFILKSAIRPAAYLLSNLGYSSLMVDYFNKSLGKNIFSYQFQHNLFNYKKDTIASSFGLHDGRTDSRALFSNYYKINNYVFIRYFFYLFRAEGDFFLKKKSSAFFNFLKFVSLCTNKKFKKKLPFSGINESLEKSSRRAKKNKTDYRVLFTALSTVKQYFLEFFPIDELKYIWKRPVRRAKVKNPKGPHFLKNRGFFYYLRKKTPKFYKSNKSLRLFKRFVRKYNSNKGVGEYKFNTTIGLAGKHFKMAGAKKYFKQKIYIRAKFMDHYRGADRTKMNNRWKLIQRARHKWHGYYNEFEGNILRASLWLGFSNKYRLSKFLVENELIFLNGGIAAGARCKVRSGDIVHLRGDVFRNIEKKRELYLFKKYLTVMPFYNKNLKLKTLYRASKLLRARDVGRASYKKQRLFAEVLKFLKSNYTDLATSSVPNQFDANQPGVVVKGVKEKWHSKVKKVSSIKFVQNVLKRKLGISASAASEQIDPRSENFLAKTGSSAMLFYKPASVNNFFYGSDYKFKKIMSPRSVKYFSERRFNY